MVRVLACLALALLAACAQACRTPGERRATLVFVSDLWGQLEPCGCSEDMKGGLDRLAAYLAELRETSPVLLVDAGDALFDQEAYRPEEEVQARIRARAVSRALLRMGLSAKVWGERDRVLDASAWLPEEVRVEGPAIRRVGGIAVGLLPLGEPPDPAAVQKQADELRSRGAEVVVGLAHVRRTEAIGLRIAGVDLVVGSHMESVPEGDRTVAVEGPPPVLYPLGRGQGVLQVELHLRDRGKPFSIVAADAPREEIRALDERIRAYEERLAAAGDAAAALREKIEELRRRREELSRAPAEIEAGNALVYRFVTISPSLPRDAEIQAILRDYDREVAEANLAYARENPRPCPEPVEGEPVFVGQAACAACHPAAQAFWEKTGHARAYATLEKASKQYDLSCISCHVTGWDQPGGPCRIDRVEDRKDVGCESCHGPGSLHVQAPTRDNIDLRVPEATCRSCHKPEHSLQFDYATYLSRILGPGHGEKMETP